MRLGITTPVLSMVPGTDATWELDGTIEDVATVATVAERLGYDFLTCAEHVVVPTDVAGERGSRYWDPLATLGYLAAVTSRIRLATNVVVLGYHHPLEIAKRYGTLDQVSGGPADPGAGGGLPARGVRAAGSTVRRPRRPGRRRAPGPALLPVGATAGVFGPVLPLRRRGDGPLRRQDPVPLWIGGRTARSLRRAVELGDGWAPFGIRAVDITSMLATARATPAWAARNRPLEVVLRNGRPLDPLGDPEGARRIVDRLVDAGATGLQVWFAHRSLAHYLEQLEAMAELIGSEGVTKG